MYVYPREMCRSLIAGCIFVTVFTQLKTDRASAAPSKGRARSRGRRAIPEPEIIEVSESESEQETRPIRPVRKAVKGVRS